MNRNYLSQNNGCTLQTSKSKEEKYLEGAVIDSEQWLAKRLHKQNITFVDLEWKKKGNNILLVGLVGDLRSGTRMLFIGRPGVALHTTFQEDWYTQDQFYLKDAPLWKWQDWWLAYFASG